MTCIVYQLPNFDEIARNRVNYLVDDPTAIDENTFGYWMLDNSDEKFVYSLVICKIDKNGHFSELYNLPFETVDRTVNISFDHKGLYIPFDSVGSDNPLGALDEPGIAYLHLESGNLTLVKGSTGQGYIYGVVQNGPDHLLVTSADDSIYDYKLVSPTELGELTILEIHQNESFEEIYQLYHCFGPFYLATTENGEFLINIETGEATENQAPAYIRYRDALVYETRDDDDDDDAEVFMLTQEQVLNHAPYNLIINDLHYFDQYWTDVDIFERGTFLAANETFLAVSDKYKDHGGIHIYIPESLHNYRKIIGETYKRRTHPQLRRLPPELIGYIEQFL
jgi:hypothetical protein